MIDETLEEEIERIKQKLSDYLRLANLIGASGEEQERQIDIMLDDLKIHIGGDINTIFIMIHKDLAKLKMYIGATDTENRQKFETLFAEIASKYTSEEDKLIIKQFVQDGINECANDIKEVKEKIELKEQLKEVAEIVSLSYIAKKYFNKSRTWLYQRINGNLVHNKPAQFTNNELDILKFAIKDISNKLGSLSIG